MLSEKTASLEIESESEYKNLYSEDNSWVEELTYRSWKKLANDDDNVWVVTFYSDYCPWCEDFEPEFYDIARSA